MAKKLNEINNEGGPEGAKIGDTVAKLSALMAQLCVGILNLDTNIQGRIDDVKKLTEMAFLDIATEVQNMKKEIIKKIETSAAAIHQRLDQIQKLKGSE